MNKKKKTSKKPSIEVAENTSVIEAASSLHEEEAEEEEAPAPTSSGPSLEVSASIKNFRHHPDMENFYRFIYENDLRFEALSYLDQLMKEKKSKA
jgi:hypothetical protein